MFTTGLSGDGVAARMYVQLIYHRQIVLILSGGLIAAFATPAIRAIVIAMRT
jgi:hypothetical protein